MRSWRCCARRLGNSNEETSLYGFVFCRFKGSHGMFAPESLASRAQALLRIVSAFLFLQHGTAKFFGVPHVASFDALRVMSLPGAAGMLELVGGALLLIGLFTRPVAFVLSGEMAVAYFIAHASRGPVLSPLLNGGESA